VRVVQILAADDAYAPPSGEFCQSWATTWGFRDVILVTDGYGMSHIYNPAALFPTHIIVDGHGIIRYRANEYYDWEPTIARIDALLAETE
jgi:hypothetical protein